LKAFFKIIILIFFSTSIFAQEGLRPLNGNIHLINPPAKQTVKGNISNAKIMTSNDLPLYEDFYYAHSSPFPSGNLWIDSSVYVNVGFAIAPPSIGVATFDGLDKQGYPYFLSAQPNVSAVADFLTSKPINLFSKGTHTYVPTDSIAISFLYQSAGFGDNPEINDSLALDLFKPLVPNITGTAVTSYGRWYTEWGARGVTNPKPNDSTFKKAFLFITDTAYFHDGFKFRLRNKATTSGSLDHWHVDNIYMDMNRTQIGDSANAMAEDVAFAYVPRPLLKNYSSMPYKQYISTEMAPYFSNFMRYNGNSIDIYNDYRFDVYDPSNALLFAYSGGPINLLRFKTYGYQSNYFHSRPIPNGSFPAPMTSPMTFTIKHISSRNVGSPDAWIFNDTVYQYQSFDNFYAYDDGAAEAAYYLNQPGSQMAMRYTLNVQDTLQALDIFFDPVTQGNLIQASGFRMYLWANSGGKPGSVIRMDSVMYPKYLKFGYNKIPRYTFTSPIVLGPGTYFFGLKQISNQQLNIGFDRNINHADALYFNIGTTWQQSAIAGSLMIHPVFGGSSQAVGINEKTLENKNHIAVYPNPASDRLFIRADLEDGKDYGIEIYSTLGQKLSSADLINSETELIISEIPAGIYFVALKHKNTILSQQKLIISR
jgi:hypothetical protein